MKNQKPILTISLLISNRPDTIPRCLDSLKPIMDAIPSELILIDTSKSAEVHELLLEYTDKVYEFEWCQDFAKARNEGLKRARGEWFMFLDDDEWFDEAEELIEFFQSGEYKKYGYANYHVRNFYNKEYTKYEDAWVSRMFRIDEDTVFIGKVHEIFSPNRGEPRYLEVYVNHSGYVFESKEEVQKHFERNSQILLKVIEEDPLNLRWQSQMVQEYRTVREWDKVVEFCNKCLENMKEIKSSMERNHFATIYAGLAEGLMYLKRYEESIDVCKRILKDERSIDLVKALSYFRMAENYVELNDWRAVKKYAEKYLACYRELNKNQELIREQYNSLVVRNLFTESYIKGAYSLLIYSELKRGNVSALQKHYDCLEWEQEDAIVHGKLVQAIAEAIATMPYDPIFSRVVTDACVKEWIRNYMCAEAQKWEEQDENVFQRVAFVYAKADSDFWFVWYCRIMVADAEGDKAEIENALRGFLKSILNGFHLPDKIHDVIKKYDIKIAKLWEDVLEDQWEAQLRYYVMNHDAECINKVRLYLNDAFASDHEKYVNFELLVMEKQIIAGPEASILDYYNILKNYADVKLHYEEAKDSSAAVKIREFIELENVDKIQALNKLKEAVDVRADFADGIGKFLQEYQSLEKERAVSQNQEMQQLRNQVLQQVFVMLDNGMRNEALQIIQQLKQMFPNDVEILELEKELI